MEHDPLLGPGRHVMTMPELIDLTVTNFPNSNMRTSLYEELRNLVLYLEDIGCPCELWINGSYLTGKIDPADIDLAIVFDLADFRNLPHEIQLSCFTNLNGQKAYSPLLDTYLSFCVSSDDEQSRELDTRDYWSKWWSRDREDNLKGYICIYVGYTDAQLQLITR